MCSERPCRGADAAEGLISASKHADALADAARLADFVERGDGVGDVGRTAERTTTD